MDLPMPERRAQNDIPTDRIWDLTSIFDLEQADLRKWLSAEADQIVGSPGFEMAAAQREAISIADQIRERFGKSGQAVSPSLLERAGRGEIQKNAPGRSTVSTFSFLKWLASLAETGVFVATAVLGYSNYFVIVVGVMLALFGWILGYGLSRLAIRGVGDVSGWIFSGFGAVGILGLALVRSGGPDGSLTVILLTVLLAFLIAVFTALELTSRTRREQALETMKLCQVWKADELHQKGWEKGVWVNFYRDKLAQAQRTRSVSDQHSDAHLKRIFGENSSSVRDAGQLSREEEHAEASRANPISQDQTGSGVRVKPESQEK